MRIDSALRAIDAKGMLLVFPADNRPDPPSLWSAFFPRTKMRWEWDESGDNRVANLWQLRARLSDSGRTVYTKWWRGRATLISRRLFPRLLSVAFGQYGPGALRGLSPTAREALQVLEDNSPLSPRVLKKALDLVGRDAEARYTRTLKELWDRFLIVGFGEIDDGAFPSLAVGATKLLFEDLWRQAEALAPAEARAFIEAQLTGAFRKTWLKAYGATALPSTLGAPGRTP